MPISIVKYSNLSSYGKIPASKSYRYGDCGISVIGYASIEYLYTWRSRKKGIRIKKL